MKYIDHRRVSVRGNDITDSYLQSCFNQQTRMYGVDYSSTFRSTGKRDEMVNLLGELQGDLCCYCMRKIRRGTPEATLEHIIPHSFTKTSEMRPYFDLGYNRLNEEQLIASREFVNAHSPNIPPRPHTVAYHNFALSCNGDFVPNGISICCNNHRGDAFVNPVYLNASIESMVEYRSDGKVYAVSGSPLFEDIVNMIRIVALNHDNLKEIRWIWYELSKVPFETLEQIETKKDRKKILLINLEGDYKKINMLAEKYKENVYWERLMSYSWFHGRIIS